MGRQLQLKQVVPVAMTDLCRACVEAELPRARESFGPREASQGWMQCWQDGGAGARAALGDYRDVTSVMTARVLQLHVQVAGLGQAAGASRCPERHLACPVLLQVGTVGCGASAPEECKWATCISLGLQDP